MDKKLIARELLKIAHRLSDELSIDPREDAKHIVDEILESSKTLSLANRIAYYEKISDYIYDGLTKAANNLNREL